MALYEDEFVDGPSFEIIGRAAELLIPKLTKSYDPDVGFALELRAAIEQSPNFGNRINAAVGAVVSLCGSPIEKFLLPWLVAQEYEGTRYQPSVFLPSDDFASLLGPSVVAVVPQLEIGRYRVDFALAHRRRGRSAVKLVLIECDGAEFHKGAANEARDRKRDAILTADARVLGIIRISGREIYHDPCASAQLAAAAFGWFWRAETR